MTVFANGLEVACKAQSNQVIAAFPYVCMTPPQSPACLLYTSDAADEL